MSPFPSHRRFVFGSRGELRCISGYADEAGPLQAAVWQQDTCGQAGGNSRYTAASHLANHFASSVYFKLGCQTTSRAAGKEAIMKRVVVVAIVTVALGVWSGVRAWQSASVMVNVQAALAIVIGCNLLLCPLAVVPGSPRLRRRNGSTEHRSAVGLDAGWYPPAAVLADGRGHSPRRIDHEHDRSRGPASHADPPPAKRSRGRAGCVTHLEIGLVRRLPNIALEPTARMSS